MRSLSPDFDPAVVAEIDRRLDTVEAGHDVAVVWAVESGSRAWGFPSPDSDYDCRFFYLRSPAAHLDPWPQRDVIETPLDPVFDVNGWDVSKAVRLAAAGNATVGEWLRSPYVYRGDPAFRDQLLKLVAGLLDPARVRRHYVHVGRAQWERSGARAGQVASLKKVFYAIRPAASLHWMDLHDSPLPPMNLRQLMAEAPPPADVAAEVEALIAAKATTRELGPGQVPPMVRAWVEHHLDRATPTDAAHSLSEETRAHAVAGYRRLVTTFSP